MSVHEFNVNTDKTRILHLFSRSCKSDSTAKSILRYPSNRVSSKWQRTLGAQSILQDEMQSPVEDSEVIILFFFVLRAFY